MFVVGFGEKMTNSLMLALKSVPGRCRAVNEVFTTFAARVEKNPEGRY